MAKRDLPTPEILRKLFSYDPETGDLHWRGGRRAGRRAGCTIPNGYVRVSVQKVRILAHRLILAMVNDAWPTDGQEVDHINHNRSDNRLANLRLVSCQENARNRTYAGRPHIGVSWHKWSGRWRAQIGVAGKPTHLGYFDDLSEAMAVRDEALRRHGFHPNHGPAQPGQFLERQTDGTQ